jgi:hypothetical protein
MTVFFFFTIIMTKAKLLSLLCLTLFHFGVFVSLFVDWDPELSSVPSFFPCAYFATLWVVLKVQRPKLSRGETFLCFLCDLCLKFLLPWAISAGLRWCMLRRSLGCDAPEAVCQSVVVLKFWECMKEYCSLWWEHCDGHALPIGLTDFWGQALRFLWTVFITALFVWVLGAYTQLGFGLWIVMDMLAVGGLAIRNVMGQIVLSWAPRWLTPWASWVLQDLWLRFWPLMLVGVVIGSCWVIEKMGGGGMPGLVALQQQDPEDEYEDQFEVRGRVKECAKCGDREAEVTLGKGFPFSCLGSHVKSLCGVFCVCSS